MMTRDEQQVIDDLVVKHSLTSIMAALEEAYAHQREEFKEEDNGKRKRFNKRVDVIRWARFKAEKKQL